MEKNKHCRPGAASGEWMSVLLPTAVLVQLFPRPAPWGQVGPLAVGSLGLAPFVAATLASGTWPGGSSLLCTSICCVASVLAILVLAEIGVVHSIVIGIISTFGFQHTVNALLKFLPLSFTKGEACVVSQGLLLFALSCASNVFSTLGSTPVDCTRTATLTVQVGLLGVGLICAVVWCVPASRAALPFYSVVLAVAAGIVVPALWFLLTFNPVLWVVHTLLADQYTIVLVLYWAACCAMAVAAVRFQVARAQSASTSTRKWFHVLAMAVFLPGLILRPCLLYLSSGVAFALFLILEVLRLLRMPPLGAILQDGYSVFVDEKDAGLVALTPLYLLAGCSVPMWLHPQLSRDALLPLLSGLLAVGVGDTAASVYGHKFGRHKWEGSKKTKEGTAASVLSQMSVVVILMQLGFVLNAWSVLWKMLVAVVASSLVEAHTQQVDNLCLPLVTYIILHLPLIFS